MGTYISDSYSEDDLKINEDVSKINQYIIIKKIIETPLYELNIIKQNEKKYVLKIYISTGTGKKYYETEIDILLKCHSMYLPKLYYCSGSKRNIILDIEISNTMQILFNKINWNKKLKLLYNTALAVEYLHNIGFIVFNLKWSSVAFDLKSNNYKLINLHSCKKKPLGNKTPDYNIEIIGTVPTIPPEILNGSYCIDYCLDSYNFGIMMIQLLTNKLYIYGEKINTFDGCQKYFKNGGNAIPEIKESCPKWYMELIKKCCSINPYRRPKFSSIVQEIQKGIIYCQIEIFRNNNLNNIKYIDIIIKTKI